MVKTSPICHHKLSARFIYENICILTILSLFCQMYKLYVSYLVHSTQKTPYCNINILLTQEKLERKLPCSNSRSLIYSSCRK